MGLGDRRARLRRGRGCVSLLLLALVASLARAEAYSEEVVKALLLERIVSFLEWTPPGQPKAPIEVVVLGEEGFGLELQRVFGRKPFAGRPLTLRHAAKLHELGHAAIVIIGPEFAHDLPAVLKSCTRTGVLTVGDTPGFGEAGVAVNFYRDGSKVRFELRPSALKRAGIQPSYKLLSLARVVGERG